MIHQRHDHPNYNERMEILCCVSPIPVPLSDLATDLGYDDQTAMRDFLPGLRDRYGVMTGIVGHHRHIWVKPSRWQTTQRIASEYWAKVYEDDNETLRPPCSSTVDPHTAPDLAGAA